MAGKLKCPKCNSVEVHLLSQKRIEDSAAPADGKPQPVSFEVEYECNTCSHTWPSVVRKTPFVIAMQKGEVRSIQRTDQYMQEFREQYVDLLPSEKQAVREVVKEIAKVKSKLDALPTCFFLKLFVSNQIQDQETGEVVYEGYGEAPPTYLLAAFDAWDKGEEFTEKRGLLSY